MAEQTKNKDKRMKQIARTVYDQHRAELMAAVNLGWMAPEGGSSHKLEQI